MNATANTAQIELLLQDTGLRPGAIIEVLASTTLRGKQVWRRYEVLDWEALAFVKG